MEISDLEPLVNAGARLLDEKQPGWFSKFTRETWRHFNMNDSYHDVLGIVFGDFWAGVRALMPVGNMQDTSNFIDQHGFDIPVADIHLYEHLTILWVDAIVERQENGVSDEPSA